jgi:hypothetical protein
LNKIPSFRKKESRKIMKEGMNETVSTTLYSALNCFFIVCSEIKTLISLYSSFRLNGNRGGEWRRGGEKHNTANNELSIRFSNHTEDCKSLIKTFL